MSSAAPIPSSSSATNLNDTKTPQTVSTPPPKPSDDAQLSPIHSPVAGPTQTPSQLALLLANALADADALRRALADEKRRTASAERLLTTFQPNGSLDDHQNGHMSECALKAVLDAEARAERAERARDDALYALHSLSSHFADLERYESSISLRTSDARSAFSRLLSTITASHPPPVSSPTLSDADSHSPTGLALPGIPPPLPAPRYRSGPAAAPQYVSSSSTRHTRPLPSHAHSSFPYPSSLGSAHARQGSHAHSASFSGLPLPPPPSASGLGSLGSGLIAVSSTQPPPSSSSSFSVPAKRSHRNRSIRGPHEGAGDESMSWEEPKRPRVCPWDMDVDEQPLPYSQHQPSPSAQPTQRLYDRDIAQHQQCYTRHDGAYPRYDENGAAVANGHVNGLGRIDARELVRGAKEREKRGQSLRHKVRENEKKRERSASRSSEGSGWSIDELLLETATNSDRKRRADGRPSPVGQHPEPSHERTQNVANVHPRHDVSQLRDVPAYAAESSRKAGSHSGHESTGSVGAVNGTIEKGRTGRVPASQLLTLGPSGTVLSGGGSSTLIPGGGYPAHNASGQRICRQCGVPGRYKDGKCVEKWGPGPEGPGTVCDRCRKKMKRVERRGTLDANAANAQRETFILHRQVQNQLQAQPTVPAVSSSGPSRGMTHADTLIVDQNGEAQTQTQLTMFSASPHSSQRYANSTERERSRNGRTHDESSRSRSPIPTHRVQPSQSQQRRAPTPPYITSISTREQHMNDNDGDRDVDIDVKENVGNEELDVDVELAHAVSASNDSKSEVRNHPQKSRYQHLKPPGTGTNDPAGSSSRASSTSTTYESRSSAPKRSWMRASAPNSKHPKTVSKVPMSNPSLPHWTPSFSARRRDTQDELDEDDGDADGDADADPDPDADADADDADPDADILDAVDATMKVED